jgi:hypothetical protein
MMSRPNVFGADTAEPDPFESHLGWRAGIAAGLVAAVTMGVGITVVEPALLRTEIAGLYGAAGSLAAGWVVHLGHGALFGLGFAVLVADPSLAAVSHRYPDAVLAGAAYGVVLALVGMGILMPMWLDAVGLAGPAIPYLGASLVAWHIVFGVVLGVAFPRLDAG